MVVELGSDGPLVSVVIPAYNDEKYIEETIQSVLLQTYKNIEIIVVDDGSSDSTAELVRQLGSNIKLLQVKNGGPAKARNAGIKTSSGEYIAFLDADDVWFPEKIEYQLDMFKENTGLVYTGRLWIDSSGNPLKDQPVQNNFPSGQIFDAMLSANYMVTSSVILRRDVIDKIGMFDESDTFLNCQDYQYWLRICSEFEAEGSSKKLIKYRVHDSNRHKNYVRRLKGMIGCLDTAYRLNPLFDSIIKERKFQLYSSYAITFFSLGEYRHARDSLLAAKKLKTLKLNQIGKLYLTYLPISLLNLIKTVRNKAK